MKVKVIETIVHVVEVPTGKGSHAAELARVDELSLYRAAKDTAVQFVAGAPISGVFVESTTVKSRRSTGDIAR
jgi:hypothetical protein